MSKDDQEDFPSSGIFEEGWEEEEAVRGLGKVI